MKSPLSVVPNYLSIETSRIPAYFENAKWRNTASLAWIGFLLFTCVVIFAAGAVIEPVFASGRNFLNLLNNYQYTVMIALGACVLFANGGFDLSVGATVALSGFIAASLVNAGLPLGLAIGAALLASAAIGAANGAITVAFRLPSFLVTLGTGLLARSLANIGLNGQTIPARLDYPAVSAIFWLVFAAAAALAIILLQFPALNAKKSPDPAGEGFFPRLVRIGLPFALTAFLAGATGIIFAARIGASTPAMGNNMELDALFIVIVGGGVFAAKRGNPLGVIVAAFLFSMISNGLSILGVSVWIQYLVKAVIFLGAVALRWAFDLIVSSMYLKRSATAAA
jgi:ribose transport system permease protein